MERAEAIATLHRFGVEGWADPAHVIGDLHKFKWVPLEKMETSHAACMALHLLQREAALADGGKTCLRHPDGLTNYCPRCQRVWPDADPHPRPPTTREAFERILAEARSNS